MTISDITALLDDRWTLLGGAILAVLTAIWLGRRVWKIAKSERPDDTLSNLGMVVGLGWSSEAVWTLTGPGGADLPAPIRIALFAVLEIILIVFMIRAKRNMRTIGHPGRAGRNSWIMATGMSLVAVWTAHNPGESFLRLLIPLALTGMWWDGLVGEGAKKAAWATSWRWTPRRLLLAIGAIEPGERDVETVHRERLIQQMTNLFFKVRHGNKRFTQRRKARLARLSLAADDDITAAVLERVDRATWFEPKHDQAAPDAPTGSVSARLAVSAKGRRALHNRRLRTVRVKHTQPVFPAAQKPEPDPRSKQEIDDAVRFIAAASSDLPQRQIAILARTSPATVNRVLRRKQNPAPPPTNGRRPELEGADR